MCIKKPIKHVIVYVYTKKLLHSMYLSTNFVKEDIEWQFVTPSKVIHFYSH